MFSLKEKVVYPGHGVAKINRIVDKKIGGMSKEFFELTFLNKEMTILIPTDNIPEEGIRKISSCEDIDLLFKLLSNPVEKIAYDSAINNWSKVNKKYKRTLESGNLREISKIYQYLKYIASQKELSFGEKSLLKKAEKLLAEEIAIVMRTGEERILELLRSQCNFKCVNMC